MKQLSNRFAELILALSMLAAILMVLGLPPVWVGMLCFVIVDIAAIAWASQDGRSGGSGLRCQPRRREHHQVMACAASQYKQMPQLM